MFLPGYDAAPPSAPQFPEHLHSLLTCSKAQGMVIWQEFIMNIKFRLVMI